MLDHNRLSYFFPVVLSNRLGMQRSKTEALCRLTEKKGAGFVRLTENGTFVRVFRLPLACVQVGKKGENDVRDRALTMRPLLFGQEKN